MRQSTVRKRTSAPTKSVQGGRMFQASAVIRPATLPAVAVMRPPSEPARWSAK